MFWKFANPENASDRPIRNERLLELDRRMSEYLVTKPQTQLWDRVHSQRNAVRSEITNQDPR
ncbi:MAG: hypothetical protein AAF362_12630 [Pseudomonadota bacterium]